jgi:hypothetical protein
MRDDIMHESMAETTQHDVSYMAEGVVGLRMHGQAIKPLMFHCEEVRRWDSLN